MFARVIHFGQDDCHRLMVLRSAGYLVKDCLSLNQLRAALETADVPDAVLMGDCDGAIASEVTAIARDHSARVMVLFRNDNLALEGSGFDLIVPCLTPPEVWLEQLDVLIEKRRAALPR
jgi:hypothetical protein